MSDKKDYDLNYLRELWDMSYEELAEAPGKKGDRLREPRFVMETKVAFEAQQLGRKMTWISVVMAIATIVMMISTIIDLIN